MAEETYRGWFGHNLKRYRQLAEMTQEILSEKLGVTSQHLSYLETGSRSPSFEVIALAADTLGVTPADLLADKSKSSTTGKQKDFIKKVSVLTKPLSKEDQERILRIIGQCVKINKTTIGKAD